MIVKQSFNNMSGIHLQSDNIKINDREIII